MKAAIYSRKSLFTGKGESIENQIELCKEYGERLNIDEYFIYEDEGFSGGDTKRPQFQQLLKDAKENKFDFLICYRLDRISRNVADFSSTLELLQENNISFVSIREQFDTSSPMGRAMVYIASVFAQLERETIAERVKDNMLQLAKTGRWLGGQEPYGFKAERITYIDAELKERSLMKLTPIKEELEVVKLIFSKYLELQSLSQVVKYLYLANIKGKNGGDWATIQVKRLLSNPLYVKSNSDVENYLKDLGINVFGNANGNGYLTYNKTKKITIERNMSEWIAAVAKHKGVIDSKEWLEVQSTQDKNKDKKLPRLGTGNTTSLLTGILKCKVCGANMKIKLGHKSRTEEGVRYNYYVCSSKDTNYKNKCDNHNIRVDRLDTLVLQELKAYNKALLIDELAAAITKEASNTSQLDAIQNLKENIAEKEKAISNLVKQLSLNNNQQVAKYIFSEMGKLNNEVNKLKDKLDLVEKNNSSHNEQIDNTEILLDTLKKFNNEYDTLTDIKQQRNLIQTIVEKITWDGNKNTFKIHLFTGDKKK
ncbi:recombinase family protein [Clostridium grantii]|uniref:Site-specific DNA recombinase n=1 Tax=Clostridium grantii DSM 8605 TaxID=1121316 RepID=A0A1M5R0B8_9CLOT|nr:recombinase family protein [Clostridium grantii]SHH19887.1 Site-specific DNA recombinase [Clostridium grantii DSM 8605]